MPKLVATVPTIVTIAGRRYAAEAGDVIDAHPSDVDRLARFGFGPNPGPEEADLEDATLGELRELAKAAKIRGRTTMTREELVGALRTGQEA